MAGKRHHTIPKFLLRNFVCEKNSSSAQTFVYSRSRPAARESIDNISVEGYFYGRPTESTLDEKITELESRIAPMVARIVESGTVDDFHPGGLAELIAHLSIRTRSVRKFGSEVFHRVHALMRTILSKDANLMVLLTSQFRSGGELRDSILEKLSVENPESAEGRAISDLIAGHSKELAKALIRENRSVVEQAIEAHIGLQKELLPGAVRLGFIDSMVRNWGADARLESFKGLNFFVVRSSTPLILGDTVAVFETGGERRFVPFVSAEDDLKTCYLPLSPDTALMACRNSNPPSFDAGQWNLIVARCSDDFIVSSIEISQEDRVLQEMGKWAGVFSERQWRQLARQMEKDLLAGKWWGSSSN